jgi:magnesium transporter
MADQEFTGQDRTASRRYALNAATVDAILAAVEVQARQRLIDLLEPLHEADIADLLEQISRDDRRRLLALWGNEFFAPVLSELEEGVRDSVIEDVDDAVLATAMQELETDDVVYLVEDLDQSYRDKLLDGLDQADRAAVEASLTYPEDSAGRLMQREVVAVPKDWTVGQAIDFMRGRDDLPLTFYNVVLIDPRHHPVANVPLGRIMGAGRETALAALAEEGFRAIHATESEQDVAFAFNKYHLVSAPVVDAGGRLVGVITIDDAMEVLDEAAEDRMKKMAGVSADEGLSDGFRQTAWRRFPWLFANVLTALVSAFVISRFSGTIEALVALAALMPIVASMGGNAATQTLTVAVRALATRDLTGANAWRVVAREALVGLANGVTFGLIIGAAGAIWFGMPMLGVVLAAALVGNLVVAALAGILVPMALNRLGADPALASGTFVTTTTDVVGFFLFLGLASVVLM